MSERIEKCPFCGTICRCDGGKKAYVGCYDEAGCNYCGPERSTYIEAIAAHNKLALACSAAPDLLLALELALKRLGELGHDNAGIVCRTAKAAIAKTKGDSHDPE